MKSALCIFLAMVACSALINAEQKNCDRGCGYNLHRQCGFNGDCYMEFPNECVMENENCSAEKKYDLDDLKMCNKARVKEDGLKYCI